MNFIEVVNTVTGHVTSVPADWLDNPVLGVNLEKSPAQKLADGDVKEETPPDESSTVKEIEAYADKLGIDLSGAGKKEEKLALVLAASPQPAVVEPVGNPDVQTVLGESDTRPIINNPEGLTAAQLAESSANNPPAGEEN